MRTDNFCFFYFQNRLIQISQTGDQWYSDTSPFSVPCWIVKLRCKWMSEARNYSLFCRSNNDQERSFDRFATGSVISFFVLIVGVRGWGWEPAGPISSWNEWKPWSLVGNRMLRQGILWLRLIYIGQVLLRKWPRQRQWSWPPYVRLYI
jgi:hypothetical protein